MDKKYDLEERLISYSVKIIEHVEMLPAAKGSNHIGSQLLRSGTSPALNYGEVQGSQSINDFLHKMNICLKELRETRICLKILSRLRQVDTASNEQLRDETEQLIRISKKSIQTAKERRSNVSQ